MATDDHPNMVIRNLFSSNKNLPDSASGLNTWKKESVQIAPNTNKQMPSTVMLTPVRSDAESLLFRRDMSAW